jgi:hypothetical protein
VHLASAVFGAGACATLWWIARALIPALAPAYVAALGLGVSRTFWSQAIIAEVYTLNVLLFLCALAACLSYLREPRRGPLLALALLAGLALSNHWPLTLLAAPGLIVALWPARTHLRRHLPREALRMIALFGLGLAPYAWMVLRSRTSPELAFHAALDGWDDVKDYVLRSTYAEGSSSVSASASDQLRFAGFYLREALWQYTPLGAALAGLGAVVGWRRWGAALSAGLTAAFLGATIGLLALLQVDYEFLNRAVLMVFPLIPYAVMALWMGLGFAWVAQRLPTPVRGGFAAGALGLALTTLILVANLAHNDRSEYAFADRWGRGVLESLEPDATVFTRRDHETFVLGYLHSIEGVRPDLRLLMEWGVGISLDGRLFHPIDVPTDEKESRVVEYVRSTEHDAYFFVRPPRPLGHADMGLYWRVDPRARDGRAVVRLNPSLLELFREMEAAHDVSDPWTRYVQGEQIAAMARVLTGMVHLHPDRDLAERFREDLDRASAHYLGLMERIALLVREEGAPLEELLAWTERAEELLDDTVSKANRSWLYLTRGRILVKMGRGREALTSFNRSTSIFPDPSNPAFAERSDLLQELRS